MAKAAIPINDRLASIMARTVEKFDGCLIWQGPVDEKGYGYIKHDRKTVRVHKFVALYSHNKSAEQAQNLKKFRITWSCGHPICLNTDHMSFEAGKPPKVYEDLVEWWK
jgi:hypothetical protein